MLGDPQNAVKSLGIDSCMPTTERYLGFLSIFYLKWVGFKMLF